MNISPAEFGQILASYTHAARSAPASADQAAHHALSHIMKGQTIMSDNITKLLAEQAKLQADVSAQTTVIASATTALTGLTTQLAAAETAAKAAGVTDDQISGFTTLRTTLESNTAALAAAIPANTSAAPVAPAAEPATTIPPAATTTEPADTAAPSGTETALPTS